MSINYIPRRFTVVRDKELCIKCGGCVNQCSNECHYLADDGKTVFAEWDKHCLAQCVCFQLAALRTPVRMTST